MSEGLPKQEENISSTHENHEDSEEFQSVFEGQLASIKRTNPKTDFEGNEVTPGWHEEEAEKATLAILEMKRRMQRMEAR